MTKYIEFQSLVLHSCKKLVDAGILVATGGNVSTRVLGEDKIAITPSNMDYLIIQPEDICILDFDGHQISGSHAPSIEYKFHLEIYKNRLDVGGVVHSHQPNTSLFSLIDTSIPALFDEQVFHLGESIDVIRYAASGSDELAQNIVKMLTNNANAYILENHGVLCMGGTIEEAVMNAMVTEKVAIAYQGALSTVKRITKLPKQSVKMFANLLKERQEENKSRHISAYK